MGITGTISAPYARARVKKFRGARTAGAGVRNAFSPYLSENIQLCCAADGDIMRAWCLRQSDASG